MAKGRGAGLRPVQDVVSRIRYDATLDAARFVVGYEERNAGVREAPLPAFVAGGDVPWHRVRYVKAGGLTVWDRQARVDLVFGSGDSPAADLAALTAAPSGAPPARPPRRRPVAFDPAACLRFDGDEWVPAGPPLPVHADAVQVATFNVLSDAYDRELTYPQRRVPACVDLLEGLGADVVALHEVTHDLWAALLAAPWVRAGYHVSAGPDPAVGYGTTLLSRWPLTLEVHRLSAYKRLLLGRTILNGQSVGFVAAHLTSDHTEGAEQRREHQLRVIDERLGRGDLDAAVVLADLNVSDDTAPWIAGFADAWRVLHPHDAGFTFDPAVNPLAAVASRTGRAARLDRVLVRGGLTPVAVERFGDRPFADDGEPRFVSDHFGVTALLQPSERTVDAASVHTSALVVRPPLHAWAPIQALRSAHDPSYRRWMPHVNLVYGFVPESEFPAAAEAVTEAVAGRTAIRVRLARFRTFRHRGSTTVWLEPETEPADALRTLQAALAARFPGCTEQDSRGAFTPHLSVAKLTGPAERIAETVARWQRDWQPVEFTIDAVDLISRRADEPFEVRHTVALATGHETALRLVTEACRAVRPGSRVHVVGSVRLGVADPSADLDLVWASVPPPAPGGDPLAALAALLPGARVAGTVVPVVRATVAGVSVDVQHVAVRDVERLEGPAADDEPSRRAVLAVKDADALLDGLDPAVFRPLLREVRAWSAARQLDGAAWGLVGGFTWALLVSEAMRHDVRDLPGFLRHCAGHPRRPRSGERHAYWPVYSPSGVNSTRTMIRSTAELVQDAFAGRGGSQAHERRVLLEPDETLGGRILGLILALEDAGARVRPYPRSPALGLDGGDPERIRASVEGFGARLVQPA
ncbi:RNA repair domain-containing protein [Dactylosporangium fulvum]|uniref:RNA repair domain-containing protein n=1 Tax=Dactylosporangium fulvum TaxID=53359 RepID=A0ABY5VQU7_9ACTN|nr:RNA repair domain-containing protein [Dactylosporangium fulvum]UWP79459.1 RNA repair domain-containing protein [Dactylosporangium fulvum]